MNFETLVTQPIFNLLTFIYSHIPGHNFGLAIILFTFVVRMLLWPLLKKQLHSSRAMKALAPELKRIKKETKGDKTRESKLTMELYKERGINPFSSLGTAIIQLPILLALFSGITKIVNDPNSIVTFSYGFIQNTGWMKELAADISKLDMTLFGLIDLTRKPFEGSITNLGDAKFYVPGVVVVLLSAIVQFYASRMLLGTDKESRGLRQILKDASNGTEADQSEVNAATMRNMMYFIPVMIFVTSINFAGALGLYWLASGFIQYLQQRYILGKDADEMTAGAVVGDGKEIQAEVIPPKPKTKPSKSKKKKRRK